MMKPLNGLRVPVKGRAAFVSEQASGHGRITDLSVSGCVLETDQQEPSCAYLTLRLDLPGQLQPLQIDLAAVRWSRGNQFGLEFIRLAQTAQRRLRRAILSSLAGAVQGQWARVRM